MLRRGPCRFTPTPSRRPPDRVAQRLQVVCNIRRQPLPAAVLPHGEDPTIWAGAAPCRPFHKPGAGCTACPRCWRSRRTAVSSSYSIEHTPTSGCVCSSTPTDGRARDPAAPTSPARAVVLARRTPRCRSSSGPAARSATTITRPGTARGGIAAVVAARSERNSDGVRSRRKVRSGLPVTRSRVGGAQAVLRAFQTSSHGQRCAHSSVTYGYRVVAPSGGLISISSSTSKPDRRRSPIISHGEGGLDGLVIWPFEAVHPEVGAQQPAGRGELFLVRDAKHQQRRVDEEDQPALGAQQSRRLRNPAVRVTQMLAPYSEIARSALIGKRHFLGIAVEQWELEAELALEARRRLQLGLGIVDSDRSRATPRQPGDGRPSRSRARSHRARLRRPAACQRGLRARTRSPSAARRRPSCAGPAPRTREPTDPNGRGCA